MRSRGDYSAAVPPFISGLTVVVEASTATGAAEAAIALTRFDASTAASLGDGEVTPLAAVLLRTESSSSSQIEQITAGARALAMASIGESSGPNAALVTANTSAMEAAIKLSGRITPAAIVAVHTALLKTTAPEHTGDFRSQPVWIGGRGSSPHSATFVPPVPSRVPELIQDLVTFTERTDVEPFLQTVIAHAQFETIHPFTEGNGRTGRALAQAMLRRYGITQRLTVPVSAGLLSDVDSYYSALNAYRQGHLEPIVEEFTRATFSAIDNGEQLVTDLVGIREDWLRRVTARSDSSVWRALPVVLSQAAVTTHLLATRLGISKPAAQTAIDHLVSVGALEPANGFRRNRVWLAPSVLVALDAFAQRAGRRQHA